MTEDRDWLLDAIGIVLVLSIIVGLALVAFAATNANTSSERTANPPDVIWSLHPVNATHVRITHDGGEAVAASNILVTVNGNRRSMTWSNRLTKGDTSIVAASRGDLVQLFWTGGESNYQLSSWRVS